ncbi:hypothetical protein KR215_002887 [Drosophila sulfurigaster]|nr:hypothetical protein KR215_002887 [Drosophila sulfurigaster]
MLLAASAGQAAPYTSYESSATRKITSNNNNNNNNVSAGTSSSSPGHSSGTTTGGTTANAAGSMATAARPTTGSSSIASTAACAIMKTLSVRLHRGTEFIKDTVQKALVMSTTTPVMSTQQPQSQQSQNLKRKFTGHGGIMHSSSGMGSGLGSSRHYAVIQPYVVPTPAFLRHFTVAPSALHRSASARKRNPSTDSLLMDLCLFKPIRPMPITPIKINKARGFELKRPKCMPPITNMYSDTDEEEDEDGDDDGEQQLNEETVKTETEVAHKPKFSTLILPQHATASAFAPHEATKGSISIEAHAPVHTKDNINTHTSDSAKSAAPVLAAASASASASASTAGSSKSKPAVGTKRRRRAPLFTAKKRRKTAAAVKEKEPPITAVVAAVAAPKRKRRNADALTVESSTTISPMRRSPPMTRQRARQQISASRK